MKTVPFSLPALPYALDALAPHISRETMEYHYGKHLQTYITNLNNLLEGSPLKDASLEKIIVQAQGAIFNNAAQVWNHEFFFNGMSPSPKSDLAGKLAEAIERDFGGLQSFKDDFSKAAAGQFGSGWGWLVADKAGKLSIVTTSNAGNPLKDDLKPLLTVDVWEHAYYIDYRNRRADFISSWWNVVDWNRVEELYAG